MKGRIEMKVYCKNCKFLNCTFSTYYTMCHCEHLCNKISRSTWYEEIFEYKREPKLINRDNDCVWYEEGKK